MKLALPATGWTNVPDTSGQVWIEARGGPLFIDTMAEDDLQHAMTLASGASIIISAGIPVRLHSGTGKPMSAYYSLV